jgi:hypothetical protein
MIVIGTDTHKQTHTCGKEEEDSSYKTWLEISISMESLPRSTSAVDGLLQLRSGTELRRRFRGDLD